MPNMPATATPARQVASPAEISALAVHLGEVMDSLLQIVEQETALVRGGRLTEVARLESAKSRLTQLYIADVTRLRSSASYLESHEPKLLHNLKQRHSAFHAQLQVNLTVLATAHAVAEGIIRGVSAEITNKARPQVYGLTGRPVGARNGQSAPMAVARSL